jgi:hypothetical protein
MSDGITGRDKLIIAKALDSQHREVARGMAGNFRPQ